jgi:hypothetical protein
MRQLTENCFCNFLVVFPIFLSKKEGRGKTKFNISRSKVMRSLRLVLSLRTEGSRHSKKHLVTGKLPPDKFRRIV